jgi:aldose 1-epimerase
MSSDHHQQPHMNNRNKITSRHFGTLPTGETVEEYTLTNANGVTLKFITYGGIINELHIPDRHGVKADVVLGFNDLAGYLEPHPYFGTITGRVAGRITGGKFTLDGRNYELLVNNPPNHLHGGALGFDKRLWKAQIVEVAGSTTAVKLTYRSPHGEEGYPGNLDVAVTYSLSDANEVIIQYEAVTDQATPVSLTNHSYFNLAGEGNGTIEHHQLQISSAEIVLTDSQMTLLGQRAPVTGLPNDFNQPKPLADALPRLLNSHGDNYLVAHTNGKSLRLVARLEDPASGRVMEALTTEDCLQLYTAAYLDGSLTGKSGRPYSRFGGLCLECQGYPDGVNHPELGNIILRPEEAYRQTTIYRFPIS